MKRVGPKLSLQKLTMQMDVSQDGGSPKFLLVCLSGFILRRAYMFAVSCYDVCFLHLGPNCLTVG